MSAFNIFKEITLPENKLPNSLYITLSASNPNFIEVHVTGKDGDVIRRTPTIEDMAEIAASEHGDTISNVVRFADDITARDLIGSAATTNLVIFVTDATLDPDVATGGATYLFDSASGTYTKVSEWAHKAPAPTTWEALVNNPELTIEALVGLLESKHSHSNKDLLDSLSLVDGKLAVENVIVSDVVFAEPKW